MTARRLALLTAVLLLALPGSAAAQETGTVTVVHGVPDTPVDVYVNGEPTLPGFQPGTVTDPLSLPPGDYEIEIFAAGADAATEEPVITGSASLPAGANASIVAHLSEAGAPTLTTFVNDTSDVAAGQARLVVRHTAAAPAVDVLAGGEPVLTGLSNPNEASVEVPAGTVSAAVAATGTTEPVIGPADLTLEAGTLTAVYAIGSLEDGTLDLLVQTVPVGGAVPSAVGAGSGGLVQTGPPAWLYAAMAGAAVLAVGSGARLLVARARR